jgi:solute carrier family 25 phosphate transporter 3
MSLMDFAKRAMPSSAYAPTATLQAVRGATNPAFAAASQKEYGLDYYLRSALAGGLCCGITHGAVTPVDVVKVRLMRARVSRFFLVFEARSVVLVETWDAF